MSNRPGLKSKFKEFQSLMLYAVLSFTVRYDSRTSRRTRSILNLVPGHFLRPSANASLGRNVWETRLKTDVVPRSWFRSRVFA